MTRRLYELEHHYRKTVSPVGVEYLIIRDKQGFTKVIRIELKKARWTAKEGWKTLYFAEKDYTIHTKQAARDAITAMYMAYVFSQGTGQ